MLRILCDNLLTPYYINLNLVGLVGSLNMKGTGRQFGSRSGAGEVLRRFIRPRVTQLIPGSPSTLPLIVKINVLGGTVLGV